MQVRDLAEDQNTCEEASLRSIGKVPIPAVIYGAGPRTVLESNAKRADEHLVLDDLKGATRVVARTLHDLLPVGHDAPGTTAPRCARSRRCTGDAALGDNDFCSICAP